MAKAYKLDKLFAMNTDYTMEADKALIIRKVGTDDTADVTPNIDGINLGVFTKAVAPLPRTYDFDLPLLDLGDLYYVVPPDKILKFTGTATKFVRCVGDILKLAPGEPLPGNYLDRFNNQGNKFVTYITGSATSGTWADGGWVTLKELVPKTVETYLFKDYVGFNVAGTLTALALNKYRVRFQYNSEYLDILTTNMGHLGIDAYQMYHPPTYNKNVEMFTLEGFPILVEGDKVFKVEAQNNTGSDLTLTSSNYPFIYMRCIYEKKS
jgi:hypothetical protein